MYLRAWLTISVRAQLLKNSYKKLFLLVRSSFGQATSNAERCIHISIDQLAYPSTLSIPPYRRTTDHICLTCSRAANSNFVLILKQ